MRPAALIFDVDGTLAETEEAHRDAFNTTFRAWDLGWHWDRDDYRQLLKTAGGRERLRAFQATLPLSARRLDDDEIARLHAAKTARYEATLAEGGLAPRPGVTALIERARAEGMRLAVATTTSRPNVDALCRCCWGRAAEEVFDAIAAGDAVAAKKPAPDVYRLALEMLALAPGDALAIEDSRIGLASARGAGLEVIVAPSAGTQGEDFAGASLLVDSLADPRVSERVFGA